MAFPEAGNVDPNFFKGSAMSRQSGSLDEREDPSPGLWGYGVIVVPPWEMSRRNHFLALGQKLITADQRAGVVTRFDRYAEGRRHCFLTRSRVAGSERTQHSLAKFNVFSRKTVSSVTSKPVARVLLAFNVRGG
jgi:hypothetical protein